MYNITLSLGQDRGDKKKTNKKLLIAQRKHCIPRQTPGKFLALFAPVLVLTRH